MFGALEATAVMERRMVSEPEVAAAAAAQRDHPEMAQTVDLHRAAEVQVVVALTADLLDLALRLVTGQTAATVLRGPAPVLHRVETERTAAAAAAGGHLVDLCSLAAAEVTELNTIRHTDAAAAAVVVDLQELSLWPMAEMAAVTAAAAAAAVTATTRVTAGPVVMA